MNILVTGGAGFIGSNLCEKLVDAGHNVICLDNFNNFYDPEIKRDNIKSLITSERFQLFEGDIRENNNFEKIFQSSSIDIVIHLAAMAGVRQSINNPMLYYDVNVNGTIVLLEAMKKYNLKKLIFASSSSVYGDNTKVPFSEEDIVDFPISPYASSKKAGELICHTYHHLYKFDVFCLRFFTVYGPRQRPDLAIHKFTNLILKNLPIEIYGDGNTERDYTYIDDTVNGILNAIDKVKGYEIINLGESRSIKLIYLIDTLEKSIGIKVHRINKEMMPGDVIKTFADISKAKRILNYNPKFDFEEGINLFLNWKLKKN